MAISDKLIIVTGGAGFIGSAVIQVLNERGYTNILVVDNLGSSEKWQNLVGKQFSHLLHKSQLFSWLEGREDEIDAIIHLGACSSTMETDANYLLENNVHYTQKLAEYALKAEIRFIYASSAATYGDGSQGFSDDHEKLCHLKPLNMYGYSKHLVDLWAYREGLLDQVVGLKYFNIFGPNEYHKGPMTSALYKMLPQIRESGAARLFKFVKGEGETEVFADGEQRRDFLYVKDAARMTVDFLEKDVGGIFNIGYGRPHTWNFVARKLFEAVKLPVHIEYVDMPKPLLGKYQNYTSADMGKFKKLFPHFEATDLGETIIEYVRDYLIPGRRW